MASADLNFQPTKFEVLTGRSLKLILAEPKDRIVPLPLEEFVTGNTLPRKYYKDGCFEQSSMTCVPLEETDPAYRNLKTFVVIGKYGTIYRYSARNALGSLSPINPLRKWTISITTHWIFSMFMSAVVLLNTVLLGNRGGKVYDHASTVIYGIEIILKITSAGLIRDPFTYLRQSWNWLDIVVISTSLIRPLKTVPVLYWARVLKVMQLTPEIRRFSKLVTSTASKLGPVLLLSSFVIYVLSLMGKLAFLGIFSRRCVSYSNYWEQLSKSSGMSSNNETTEEKVVSWKDFAQNQANWFSNQWCLEDNDKNLMECFEDDEVDFECVPGTGRNPDHGTSNFDTIGWSGLQTIRIINQDLGDLFSQLTNASASATPASIYLLVTFFFGTYALGTFAYGVVGKHVFDFLQKKYNNSAPILKDQSQESVANSLSTPVQQPSSSNKDHVERFVEDVLQGIVFEVLITLTILLDTLALSLQHENMPYFAYHFSKWMIRLAMVIYTLEFILQMYSLGPRIYFVKGWQIFDFVMLVDMYLQIFYRKYFISLPIRVFKLTPRWNTLTLMFKIVVESVKSLWGLVGALGVLGTFFALVGASEFRQNYIRNKHHFQDDNYPQWGFADFMHSTMIVFRIWIGEFHEMLGECLLVQEQGCLTYFATIGITGTLILMSLTVGVIFVTNRVLKSRESLKWKPSVLAKMFCYPYVWLRTQDQDQPPITLSSSDYKLQSATTTFPLSCLPTNTKKIITCSPTPGGSTVLRGISSFIIIIFSLVLVLDNIPYENDINVESLVYAVDVVFTIFIAIMVGYNLVVLGVKYCVTSPGWIFDVCVVLEMIVNMLYDLKPDMNPYPTFYLFRSLRPFMLVSRIEVLEVVLRGFLCELKFLWKFILAGAFICFYFAILGTKMFSGTIGLCQLNNSTTVIYNKGECLASNQTWTKSDINFEHVGKSLISLAYAGKNNFWKLLFYDYTDTQTRQMLFIFGVLFICGMFLMMNVIFGVLYYNLNKFEGFFLTKEHFNKAPAKPTPNPFYSKPNGKYRTHIYNLVSSIYFDFGILVVILLDTFCLAWIDAEIEFWSQDLPIANKIRTYILFVYFLELFLKLVGWGKTYFYNGWNQFDFLVVVFCSTEMVRLEFGYSSWIILDFFRILRILRIFQFQPLVKRVRTWRVYGTAMKKFSLVFRNLIIFHCLLMYSYSLIGIRKFGHTKLTKGVDEYFNFRTVGSSFRVLFMLSSISGIDEILPALTLSGENCTPDWIDATSHHYGDCGSTIWGTIFVFSYIFFSFLTFTNLYMFFIFEIVKQLTPSVALANRDKAECSENCYSNANTPSTTPMPTTSLEANSG